MAEEGYKIISIRSNEPRFKLYRAFVANTFLDGMKYGNDTFKKIDRKVFFDKYNALLAVLFHKPIIVKIAVMANDPDHYLGFSMIDGNTLHFVYVRPEVRGGGIARELVPNDQIKQFSHITKLGNRIWKERRKEWIFNPFI